MTELPLEPQMAKMLLISPEYDCSNEMLSIVAMLSSASIFMRPREAAKQADEKKLQFAHTDGDHLSLLNVYHAYKQASQQKEWCYENFINYRSLQSADSVRDQLARIMRKLALPLFSTDFNSIKYYQNLRRCIAAGLFMQVAHLQKQGHYLTAKDNQVVAIHPSSVLEDKPPWILFQDFVLTSRNFVRSCTAVRLDWLLELAPHYFDLESWPEGDTKVELERSYRRLMQEMEEKPPGKEMSST